jgi:uncharacterized membrane protein YedE/YeeE
MENIANWFLEPWTWYVSGPLIGLTVPLLLIVANKNLGISSSFRHVCASCVPNRIPFFQYNWKAEAWNLFFAAGILLGGLLTELYLTNHQPIEISASTREALMVWGITDFNGLAPAQWFGSAALGNPFAWLLWAVGGLLIGFGTRYAGGCTSGHAIMGLSNLQWPSLIAVIGFFAGGLLMTHFIMPLLF